MPMFKKSLLILLLLAVMAAGGAIYKLQGNQGEPLPAQQSSTVPDRELVVYVSGAVAQPGVIRLQEGARAQDAVKACGGFLPQADQTGINLAQPLKDGQQLNVPTAAPRTESKLNEPDTSGKGKKAGTDEKVNVNTADVQGLQRLHGIGPALAQRIVEYRQQHGVFQTAEELLQVKGIGEAKLEKMREQLLF